MANWTQADYAQWATDNGFIRKNGGLTPARVLAVKANRRARMKHAMPKWVDKNAIKQIYKEASEKCILEGVSYHVDHIVPLCGKNVCGLHVPWNLRITLARDNMKKGNRI